MKRSLALVAGGAVLATSLAGCGSAAAPPTLRADAATTCLDAYVTSENVSTVTPENPGEAAALQAANEANHGYGSQGVSFASLGDQYVGGPMRIFFLRNSAVARGHAQSIANYATSWQQPAYVEQRGNVVVEYANQNPYQPGQEGSQEEIADSCLGKAGKPQHVSGHAVPRLVAAYQASIATTPEDWATPLQTDVDNELHGLMEGPNDCTGNSTPCPVDPYVNISVSGLSQTIDLQADHGARLISASPLGGGSGYVYTIKASDGSTFTENNGSPNSQNASLTCVLSPSAPAKAARLCVNGTWYPNLSTAGPSDG